MSIKARLWLSHILMIMIPIILSLITAKIIFNMYTSSYGNVFHDGLIEGYMYRSSIISNELKIISSENPDMLKDQSYLKELEKKLEVIETGVIVTENNLPLYVTDFLNKPEIIKKIVDASLKRNDLMRINNYFLLGRQDFYFNDQSAGSIYLITNTSYFSGKEQGFQKYAITVIIIFIIILVLTNTILTYLMTKYIMKPLKLLKEHTNRIKEGHLNFQVTYNKKDEIGELFSAFEEMRSQLKESEEIKNKYENNRKELLSNISHDLRTPVTSIKGYVEGIIDGIADTPEKMNKYLKTIYNKTIDMDQLIEELFLLSKLDLKKVPFHFEKVDLQRYFADLIEELQFDIEEKGIRLHFHSQVDEISLTSIDREQLKRVIVNIIGNSIQHMDKDHPMIEITLDENKDHYLVIIADNGEGIPNQDLPFIFDRFYRADPARSTETGGTGLGLAIAKQIIEEHGGKIWAESLEGIGTSIFFTLKKEND